MRNPAHLNPQAVQAGGRLSVFEKYLTLWVFLCIGVGIALGRLLPSIAETLDSMSVYNVSIPIAVCLFFMMYPIMVKIDFSPGSSGRPHPQTSGFDAGHELASQTVYDGCLCSLFSRLAVSAPDHGN